MVLAGSLAVLMVGGIGHFNSHRSITQHAHRDKDYLHRHLSQKLGYCFRKEYKLMLPNFLESHTFYFIFIVVIKDLTKSNLEEEVYSAYEFRSQFITMGKSR